MGTDTTSGEQTQPISVRRMLALIALADDLPTPHLISFIEHRILSLHLDTLSDATRWTTWFDVKLKKPGNHSGSIWFRHEMIDWHGWNVQLGANESIATAGQLDPDTRTQLEQVADVTPTMPNQQLTEYVAPDGAASVEHPA